MSNFDKLHPALQHHVVNSLGWKDLRPLQEASILPILDGDNLILIAPTAGGKTEAAVFPVFSAMLAEEWKPLSVLYLCPIKALLNNLGTRLSTYCELIGRRVGIWHGDISQSEKAKLIAEPPDVLLTTPESLQVLLVSKRVEHQSLFGNVKTLIVDELHAFAGDDRGWHLLAVTESLCKIAKYDIQRLGLSATVGNPETLLRWLSGSSSRIRTVIKPEATFKKTADVQIDYVGTVDNAGLVISRLHRGEKRLVFCDSRTQVEKLASNLRSRDIETFVSHSSLSLDERKRAEAAFAEGSNCVIVATSTLELGIDVGDLDRVIQLEAPATVASFLQRLGRTGRRSESQSNCLFLTTRDSSLLHAAGLVRLWENGFVEPIQPPEKPIHVLAQQMLTSVLQERQLTSLELVEWVENFLPLAGISRSELNTLIDFMVKTEVLFEDSGILSMGSKGEKLFGHKNFMDLFSVFDSPPLFNVRFGRQELGMVHELSFWRKREGGISLSLGGRSWKVGEIEWKNRIVYVEPSDERGQSIWLGESQWMSFELCRSIRSVLVDERVDSYWSKRAGERVDGIRREFAWLKSQGTTLMHDKGKNRSIWWTFAGMQVNVVLSEILAGVLKVSPDVDNNMIDFKTSIEGSDLRFALRNQIAKEIDFANFTVNDELVNRVKFRKAIPESIVIAMLRNRILNLENLDKVGAEIVSEISISI